MTWIKADIDFGISFATLVIGSRTLVGKEFLHLRKLLNELSKSQNSESALESMEYEITKFIESRRPELSGLALIGIEYKLGGMKWALQIMHPSLPSVKISEFPKEQMLEPCFWCKGPIYVEGNPMQLVHIPDGDNFCKVVSVCSDKCCEATKDEYPLPDEPHQGILSGPRDAEYHD